MKNIYLSLLVVLATAPIVLGQTLLPTHIDFYNGRPGNWELNRSVEIMYEPNGFSFISSVSPGEQPEEYRYAYDSHGHIVWFKYTDRNFNYSDSTVFRYGYGPGGRIDSVSRDESDLVEHYRFHYGANGFMDSLHLQYEPTSAGFTQRAYYGYSASGQLTRHGYQFLDVNTNLYTDQFEVQNAVFAFGFERFDPYTLVTGNLTQFEETVDWLYTGGSGLGIGPDSDLKPMRYHGGQVGSAATSIQEFQVNGSWFRYDSTYLRKDAQGNEVEYSSTNFNQEGLATDTAWVTTSNTYGGQNQRIERIAHDQIRDEYVRTVYSNYVAGTRPTQTTPLRAQPNPVRQTLIVQGAAAGQAFDLIDTQGRSHAGTFGPQGRVEVPDLLPGLYVLRIGGRQVRFVKE